jgi:hypothetical protein
MVYTKRLIWAIILGMVFGLICVFAGMKYMPAENRAAIMASTFLNRAIIGLLIGVSAWKMHWALHGIILGFVGSLPIAVFPHTFIVLSLAGIVWGFLIELLLNLVFKAPMKVMAPVVAAPKVE